MEQQRGNFLDTPSSKQAADLNIPRYLWDSGDNIYMIKPFDPFYNNYERVSLSPFNIKTNPNIWRRIECLNPWYGHTDTHRHTHTHIYIYIYIHQVSIYLFVTFVTSTGLHPDSRRKTMFIICRYKSIPMSGTYFINRNCLSQKSLALITNYMLIGSEN